MSDALALYIHWPFCESKCAYCDFNSHVRENVDQARWRAALLTELAYEAERTQGQPLVSIFFGGGTPSLMDPTTVDALIAAAQKYWPTTHELEITLEANPSSVEAGRFADIAAAGVNRLSLGVQALDDAALQFLTRRHDLRTALQALEVAQATFARVSFDLIYARPGQSLAAWQEELEQALAFNTEHLSLYQLTIEPNTGFAGMYKRGGLQLPDEDLSADLFTLTQELTEKHGLSAYEISNHARSGGHSRHNFHVWAYGDYIGIGPGAHGRRRHCATIRHKRPEVWLHQVETHRTAMEEEKMLDITTRAEEAVLMGLRLTEGINTARFAERTGTNLYDLIAADALAIAVAEGLLIQTPEALLATPRGRLLLNRLTAHLLGA